MWSGAKIVLGAVLLCGVPRVALADRYAQAHGIFTDNCSRCHATEVLRPKTSSVKSAAGPGGDKKKDRLRTWLERPTTLNPDSLCEAYKLDLVQRELVLSLLRCPGDPMARSAAAPRIPSAKNGGLARRPANAGPVLGQGDHR